MEQGFAKPSRTSGHSLGQIEAAVAAGALKFTDAVRFSELRADLLKEFANGKIAVVLANRLVTREEIENELKQIVQEGETLAIANANAMTESSSQIGISGTRAAIERAKTILEAKGYRFSILKGDIAFHNAELLNPSEK